LPVLDNTDSQQPREACLHRFADAESLKSGHWRICKPPGLKASRVEGAWVPGSASKRRVIGVEFRGTGAWAPPAARGVCMQRVYACEHTSMTSISNRIERSTSLYETPPSGSSSRSPSSSCERTILMATSRCCPLTSRPRCTTANDPSPIFGPTYRTWSYQYKDEPASHQPAAARPRALADQQQQIAGSSRPACDCSSRKLRKVCVLEYLVVGSLAHRHRMRFHHMCLFRLLLCPLHSDRLDVMDKNAGRAADRREKARGEPRESRGERQ